MNRLLQNVGRSLLLGVGLAGVAAATPIINSAVLHTRVFNDFPNSTLTTSNLYPTLIEFFDGPVGPGTFANRHNFRLSADGGASDAVFANGDGFVFESDVTLTGTAPVEGGLQVSPWWAQEVDGQFNIRASDGEVACFGGRLPFYSFTASQGLHYSPGTTIHQKMIYNPRGLSSGNPATIEYIYRDSSGTFTSGPLAFDQGNAAEDPPHGLWGMLNGALVGGCVQVINTDAGQHSAGIRFQNMNFIPVPCPGDLNGDNVVDLSDLAGLLAHFGGPGSASNGDINGDGLVDLRDLAILLAHFGSTC